MNEREITLEESHELKEEGNRFFQVDLLKSFMIILVILDHTIAYAGLYGKGFELWERISIPMFLVIMGFNMGKSFSREGDKSLRELYSWSYFKKKFWRYLYPYLILYIVGTIFGFILYGAAFPDTFKENWFLEYIVFQKSLLEGPGNWFIPVLFQSIIIMPLLYKAFSKWPKLSLILCFVIEFFMHLTLFFIFGEITSLAELLRELNFRYNILLYLSAIGMGIWFSKNHDLFNKKNIFVWILFPFSLIYMIAWDFFGFRLAIDGAEIVRGDYHYLTFIYSAFLFLIAMRLISQNPKTKIARVFTVISSATFHIYLVQDIYFIISYVIYNPIWQGSPVLANIFGIQSNEFFVNGCLLILNWVICISCGVFWWYVDNKIIRYRLTKKT
ncbi:MAG: acyltransferase [Candidatus Lokiarchaeota archaeon]|nr:acyltransferase [Candidatus Lokiarchaeota archaeon]